MRPRPEPEPIEPGQESVWAYPRPPRLEPSVQRVQVFFDGHLLIDTRRALRMLETSHPPTYYLPLADFDSNCLRPSDRRSFCEWKGRAEYFDLVHGDRREDAAAWTYPAPTAAYAALAGHLALYPGRMDRCLVDGETVIPQPGGFYGGWITGSVRGPFKGEPGTEFW